MQDKCRERGRLVVVDFVFSTMYLSVFLASQRNAPIQLNAKTINHSLSWQTHSPHQRPVLYTHPHVNCENADGWRHICGNPTKHNKTLNSENHKSWVGRVLGGFSTVSTSQVVDNMAVLGLSYRSNRSTRNRNVCVDHLNSVFYSSLYLALIEPSFSFMQNSTSKT